MHKHHQGFDDWDARADELEREGEIGLPWFEAAADWVADVAGTSERSGANHGEADRAGTGTGERSAANHGEAARAGARAGRESRRAHVRRVLDVGSGPGVASCVLAARFPAASVVAVDSADGLLIRARARAERLGVADRIDTLNTKLDGDLTELPEADLIWASRVLHHVPDQPKALRALATRLRAPDPEQPGGLLALVEGGLPSRFLPDESGIGPAGLLNRLDAAVSTGLTARLGHDHSSPVPRPVLDWPRQLRQAGLTPSGSRSFLLDLPAPVTPAVREHLAHRLARTESLAGEHLSAADRAAVEQLLDRENPLGVWRRPDLFLLSAVTVHTARRSG